MTSVTPVSIGSVTIGGGRPLVLIGGPCVIESEAHAISLGTSIAAIASRCGVPYIFKASFDKANRTSIRSYRGPGLDDGLRILAAVKAALGVPVLTDIHEPGQAARAAEVVDALQIPAFLCRQTDLLLAAARTGKAVNIKKGQFLSPHDVRHAIEKITTADNRQIIVTERGASFGYNNLVVDMRSFPILRGFGFPVVFDVTHSLQLPGGGDGVTAGQAQYIDTLAPAGVAAGIDGVFLEIHENPRAAKSDAQNALALGRLEPLLRLLVGIDTLRRASDGSRP
jgi:2-dehydro-3-deoxyphosphooctonate aldolase (KDO 8-P synthase)